jgi:hypothetical protein
VPRYAVHLYTIRGKHAMRPCFQPSGKQGTWFLVSRKVEKSASKCTWGCRFWRRRGSPSAAAALLAKNWLGKHQPFQNTGEMAGQEFRSLRPGLPAARRPFHRARGYVGTKTRKNTHCKYMLYSPGAGRLILHLTALIAPWACLKLGTKYMHVTRG